MFCNRVSSSLFSPFRYLGFLILCFSVFSGQLFAQNDPIRHRSAPESCIFFTSWKGFGKIDPARSETEKWMSQPELVQFGKKLEQSIFLAIDHNLASNKMQTDIPRQLAKAGAHALLASVEHPGSAYLSEFQISESLRYEFGIHLKLGKRFSDLQKINKEFLQALKGQKEVQVTTKTVDSVIFHTIQSQETPVQFSWALDNGMVHIVSSPEVWKKWKDGNSTPTPAWLSKIKKQSVHSRLSSVTFFNFKKFFQSLDQQFPPELKAISKDIGLDKLQDLTVTTGMNNDGTVIKGQLNFSDSNIPMLDFFPDKGWTKKDFDHIRKGEHFLIGMRMDTQKLMKFVDLVAESTKQPNVMRDMFEDASKRGFQLETLLGSLGPGAIVSGRFAMPNPAKSMGISIEINDKEKFETEFAKIIEDIKRNNQQWPEHLPQENKPDFKKRNGYMMASFSLPPNGNRVYFGQDGKKLALALSSRRVAKILKGKPAAEKMTDSVFLEKVFKNSLHKEGKLFLVSSIDSAPGILVTLPGFKTIFPADNTIPGTDLSVQDVPSAKVIVNGWRPTVSAFYRTKNGIEFSSQMTAPVMSPGLSTGVLAGLLLPAIQQAREAARRTVSMNNVKMMGLCLRMYHDTYKRFPAKYSVDEDGKPLLSWRVHILQFTEYNHLYERFHIDEPWDSPHNKKLLKEMPPLFDDLRFPNVGEGKTVFLGVSGKDGAFSAPKKFGVHGNGIPEFTDGTANTAMVIQVGPEHAVPWTAPMDFDYEEKGAISKLQYRYNTGTIIGLTDGSVRVFEADTDWESLKAIFTKSSKDILQLLD